MARLTPEQKASLAHPFHRTDEAGKVMGEAVAFFNETSRMYLVTDEMGMPLQVGLLTPDGNKIELITLAPTIGLPIPADATWNWATQSPDAVGYSATSPEGTKITRKASVTDDGGFEMGFRIENKGDKGVAIPSFSQTVILASPAGLRTSPRLTNEGDIISTGAEAMIANRAMTTLAQEPEPTEFPYAGEVMIDLLGLPDDRAGYLLKVGGFDQYRWASGVARPDDQTTSVPLTLISTPHQISPSGVHLVNFRLQRVSKIDRDRLASGQDPFSDYN